MTRAPTDIWRFSGAVELPVAGNDIAPALGRKHVALLAMLAISARPVPRGDLARLLWPEADPARARHNLRQALVAIRKALGEDHAGLLMAEGEDIALGRPGLATDLDRFAAIEAGAEADAAELAALCRGPLLDGFRTGSAPFDRRLEEWRGEHALRMAGVIRRRLAAGTDGGVARRALEARLGVLECGAVAAAQGAPAAPVSRRRFPVFRTWTAALVGLAIGAATFLGGFAAAPEFRVFLREMLLRQEGDVPRIAVRPFTSVNGSPVETGLAGGVTIGVTYALYAVTARELYVITVPPSSGDGTLLEEPAYAAELGVRYLISGTLEIEGQSVRVFVRCLDTGTGSDIWQDRFTSPVTEAFRLQDEIALRILRGLAIDLSTAERNRLQYLDDTENLQAWLYAADGVRNLIKLELASLDDALASYRRALELDPDYISARRGLAWHALLQLRFGTAPDPGAAIIEARNHLGVILRRRPDDGMSRALEGLMLLMENSWDGAVASGREATMLLPGSADVWAVLAHSYTFTGEFDQALAAIDRAMSLSPGHPAFYRWIKGRALRLGGAHDAAIEMLEVGLTGDDVNVIHLVEMAAAYAAAGRIAEARATALRIRAISPEFSASAWILHPAARDPDQQSREFELLSKAGL